MAIFMYMKEPSGPAIMSYLYTLVGNYLEPLVAITILPVIAVYTVWTVNDVLSRSIPYKICYKTSEDLKNST